MGGLFHETYIAYVGHIRRELRGDELSMIFGIAGTNSRFPPLVFDANY